MKIKSTPLHLSLSAGLLLLLPGLIQAQPTAHYCPGAEGLDAASVPPPGVYVRDYNMFYTADHVNNAAGQKVANFNAFVYANVPRVIWMSQTKFLGADVGADALLPLVDTHLDGHVPTFGAGDLLAAGILAWHPQRFDFTICDGVWMPTGNFSPGQPTSAGKGYWGDMLTAGGTWYMDAAKTWTISALNRYEFNGEQEQTHITPGQAYTVEGGIGKSFENKMSVGAAGYYQQKVTADSGAGTTSHYNRVAAIGPEIGGVIPKIDVMVSLRYLYEFLAEGQNQPRLQGQTVTLTLTKRF
jgi:hypothetical protein